MGPDDHCYHRTSSGRRFQLQYVPASEIIPSQINSCHTVVDLQSYPSNVFSLLMTLGLFFVRKRRLSIGAPKTEFRAWNIVLLFALAVNVYILVLPWVPPAGGIYAGDVSFFYATYCIVGLAMCVFSLDSRLSMPRMTLLN